MFITDTDFEKYETHRVGNFLQDSQDEIFHKITNNKTYYLFCKTCLQEQKECFYLDDGVTMLNAIVREFFPSLD